MPIYRYSRRPALGAFPTDSYFDPNRSSWVPYWIDTPTESAMKWGFYPGADTKTVYQPANPPPPPPAPQTREEMLTWTPTTLAQRNASQFELWRPTAIPDLPQSVKDALAGKKSTGALWIYAAAGIAALLLLRGIAK